METVETKPLKLSDYRPFVGSSTVRELQILASKIQNESILNVNSTAVGGGVAEILARLIPLFDDLGIESEWKVVKGNEDFFEVTKDIHNGLHGKEVNFDEKMSGTFREVTEMNKAGFETGASIVIIHDPQPIGLVEMRHNRAANWVWRCHVDVSNPDPSVWNFLDPFVDQFDAAIFSMPEFAKHLPIPQFLIAPSIDPLADKNKELSQEAVYKVLEKYNLDPERPIVTQVSRFDRLKDPVGVIEAYKLVKRHTDCQLVLAGGGATDDPEGAEVLAEVQNQAEGDPDIHILELPPFSDLEINALARGSTVVLQKSIREGFGLTVTEALWKKKPVIGGAVGGIKKQIINGITGFLVNSVEGAAFRIEEILTHPELGEKLGANGREHVRTNFLLTRHLKDYILLLLAFRHPDENVVELWP